MRTKIAVLLVSLFALAVSWSSPAAAAPLGEVTATPDVLAVGEVSTVTATGLGFLGSIRFEVSGAPGGALAESGVPSGQTSLEVAAVDGEARAVFAATQAGTFTIEALDGEAVLGVANVQVAGLAPPTAQTSLAASPATVRAGETSTLTATGLGNVRTVLFSLDSTPGGSLSNGEIESTTVSVPVSGGTASADFTSTELGAFQVSIGDGTSLFATAVVNVTLEGSPAEPGATPGASASPGATASASASPSPTADADVDQAGSPVVWIVLAAVLVVAAGVTTAVIVIRRRRS